MTTSDNHRYNDLQRLETQCGRLKSQCTEYVRRLKAANQDLSAEIAKRKEAEASIRQAHAEKKLVAREIHRRSRRHAGPLIKVNCATIPKDLYESEFFGNEPSLNHDADENTQSGNQHPVLSLRPGPRGA